MQITPSNNDMQEHDVPGSFYTTTCRAARWKLGVFLGFAVLSVATSLSPSRIAFYDREPTTSDLKLYWSVVHRVANDEPYYRVSYEEMTILGHPTISVFNWRSPLPMWLLAKLPNPEYGRWILSLLGVCLLLFGTLISCREGSLREGFLCGVFLSGTAILCLVGYLSVSPILWSSVLVGLSLCAYGLDHVRLAVCLGIAAIIFRELAMPYCLLMVAIAIWRRQWSELSWWALGLAGFTIFYLVHASHVVEFAGTAKIVDTTRWTQFLGLPAVVGYSQNGFLLLLPQWVTAVYLAFALLGLSEWRSLFGRRVAGTTLLFLMTFAIIGRDVNQYWGTLVTPLLCFGVARAPASLLELMQAASSRE